MFIRIFLVILLTAFYYCPAQAVSANVAEIQAKAQAGDDVAANKLGVWYEKGKNGLPVDPKMAVHWYGIAAKKGNGLALHNLGDCYRDGIGVEQDNYTALDYYLQAAAGGLPLGYEDVGDSILIPEIAEDLLLETAKERQEAAILWYRKAADHERESAKMKLKKMGQPVLKPSFAPLPICPTLDLEGTKKISGTFLEYTTPRSADAYGYLIRTANGEKVEIVMGNGDIEEFADLGKGDTITLSYSSYQSLDIYTAECSITHFYVENSGKILKKAQ